MGDAVMTYDELPSILMGWFPSSKAALDEVIRERADEGAVLAFGIVSECFWWGIFEPALRLRDLEMIERCLRLTEHLLDEGDTVIHDAVIIRVIEYLFDPTWYETVLQYAGPAVRGILTRPDNS
ncbi:hypothetical protein [Kribbella sp. NPDC050470]|uniref:DUF7674 family protein n=1 Tax=unclassified Kribbella TaxID=2644121 RepID=UPI003793CFB3